MTTTHTPGPWKWDGHWLNGGLEKTTVLWYTTADDGVHCDGNDARLIAAAPDLLAALVEMDRMEAEQPVRESARFDAWLDRKYKAIQSMRAAIAKTEGK